jgi:hypothetical protein
MPVDSPIHAAFFGILTIGGTYADHAATSRAGADCPPHAIIQLQAC